eukprot:TRINITY_DN67960_c0_g1_i1.p1 TRINITY_DN67960_c0_g1~~TRINITY_DN67960_c0_g1_i1.p1  ORF type:complete len:290 (+),score=42.69 TRINITY_DN67960_c0_g1_i1:154-1023(+)
MRHLWPHVLVTEPGSPHCNLKPLLIDGIGLVFKATKGIQLGEELVLGAVISTPVTTPKKRKNVVAKDQEAGTTPSDAGTLQPDCKVQHDSGEVNLFNASPQKLHIAAGTPFLIGKVQKDYQLVPQQPAVQGLVFDLSTSLVVDNGVAKEGQDFMSTLGDGESVWWHVEGKLVYSRQDATFGHSAGDGYALQDTFLLGWGLRCKDSVFQPKEIFVVPPANLILAPGEKVAVISALPRLKRHRSDGADNVLEGAEDAQGAFEADVEEILGTDMKEVEESEEVEDVEDVEDL